MKWIISSSRYCILIVSFSNFNCNSRVMCCKDSFKGTHCNRMFCDLWISNSCFICNYQGQNIQSTKLSNFGKKVSLLTKQKSPSLLKKYGIQKFLIVIIVWMSVQWRQCNLNTWAYFFMQKVIKSYKLFTPIVLQFVLNPKRTNYARFYWREYKFLQVLRNTEKWN